MLYIIPGDLRALLSWACRYIPVYTRTDIGLKDSRRTPRRGSEEVGRGRKRAGGGGKREEEGKLRAEGGGKREGQHGRLEWEV